jgi:predicted DNA repair protein MutK
MPSGLVALLDDVAAIAKLAAASLDDVAGAAGKAGAKAAGVVIDDTAVTPRYVVGLTPDRELPIIGKIAMGSLRNKLLFLLPAALRSALRALGDHAAADARRRLSVLRRRREDLRSAGRRKPCRRGARRSPIPRPELEDRQVGGAVRTDFILSAEIMASRLPNCPRNRCGCRRRAGAPSASRSPSASMAWSR